jgi:hypothetical protein
MDDSSSKIASAAGFVPVLDLQAFAKGAWSRTPPLRGTQALISDLAGTKLLTGRK